MSKKTVLITGYSRGLGLNVCSKFLLHGYRVIGISRNIKELRDVECYRCDVSNEAEVKRLGSEIIQQKIDRIVNCAGITQAIKPNSEKDIFQEIIAVNLLGTYFVNKYFLPHLRASKTLSTIVNVASIGGKFGFSNNPGYGASKAGIINLTKSLALDYAKFDIRVNCVSPGYFKSDMTSTSFNDPELRRVRENNTILKRFGEASEVADAILFLSSNQSSYITGENIMVDGGFSAKGLVE